MTSHRLGQEMKVTGITALIMYMLQIATTTGLTCLQCRGISQPRHCKFVEECHHSEFCGVEKVTSGVGEVLYNVGCVEKTKCYTNTSHAHNIDCLECCERDLCNAQGCGEPGYPSSRGPVCYTCPMNTDPWSCHQIDVCNVGEICEFRFIEEFGDLVYTGGCVDKHACLHFHTDSTHIFGRDLTSRQEVSDSENKQLSRETRSLMHHVCSGCCDRDLCNKQCNMSIGSSNHTHAQTACEKQRPCVHGTCVDFDGDFFHCSCHSGFTGVYCNESLTTTPVHTRPVPGPVTDCYDIKMHNPSAPSGVYNVTLWRSRHVLQVLCDMNTDNGGWTIFQRRYNGSVDFFQNFTKYENGFGSLYGEFWLGLKYIQEMTFKPSELRIDLTAASGKTGYDVFKNFSLSAAPNYTLHIERGNGTAGGAFYYHEGMDFSTMDRPRDVWPLGNCAEYQHGGFWFRSCSKTTLNAPYLQPGLPFPRSTDGIIYASFDEERSLKAVKMMFRRMF